MLSGTLSAYFYLSPVSPARKDLGASFFAMRVVENNKMARARGDGALNVVRFPRRSRTIFSGTTRAVEYGFLAAGVTVAALAALQSIATVAGWLSSF
jgi:hypothetical protein